MKKILSRSLLAALAATGFVSAAEVATAPVGYVTETIKAGQFNLMGLTVQNPIVASGKVSTVASGSISDLSANYDSALVPGSVYVLKIVGGTGIGAVQEISSWSATSLVTPDNLTSVGLQVGDAYQIRKAPSVSDIFGPNNEAGLQSGASLGAADVIWVPKVGGAFAKYFYKVGGFGATGWRDALNGSSASAALIYADAIMLERRGSTDLKLVLKGEVELTPMKFAVESGLYNYVGGVYPVGATLGNSGLASQVLGGGALGSADEIWFSDGLGGYIKCYYKNAGFGGNGWRTATNAVADSQPISSGFIIRRKGETINMNITPPPSYQSL